MMAGSGSCCQGRFGSHAHEGCQGLRLAVVLGCSGPREHSWRIPAAWLGELGYGAAALLLSDGF